MLLIGICVLFLFSDAVRGTPPTTTPENSVKPNLLEYFENEKIKYRECYLEKSKNYVSNTTEHGFETAEEELVNSLIQMFCPKSTYAAECMIGLENSLKNADFQHSDNDTKNYREIHGYIIKRKTLVNYLCLDEQTKFKSIIRDGSLKCAMEDEWNYQHKCGDNFNEKYEQNVFEPLNGNLFNADDCRNVHDLFKCLEEEYKLQCFSYVDSFHDIVVGVENYWTNYMKCNLVDNN